LVKYIYVQSIVMDIILVSTDLFIMGVPQQGLWLIFIKLNLWSLGKSIADSQLLKDNASY